MYLYSDVIDSFIPHSDIFPNELIVNSNFDEYSIFEKIIEFYTCQKTIPINNIDRDVHKCTNLDFSIPQNN